MKRIEQPEQPVAERSVAEMTFAMLAEPSRRVLLNALLDGEAPVNRLVQISGMSQPVVSKHLKILRKAGLVSTRPDGQRRLYQLRPEPLKAVDEWLEPYREFWAERLDALEVHLKHQYENNAAVPTGVPARDTEDGK